MRNGWSNRPNGLAEMGSIKGGWTQDHKRKESFGAAELKLGLFTDRSFGMEEFFHSEAWRRGKTGQCCSISDEPHWIEHIEGPMKRGSFPGAAGLSGSARAAPVPLAQRKRRVGRSWRRRNQEDRKHTKTQGKLQSCP